MNVFYEMSDDGFIQWVGSTWGIRILKLRQDLDLQGSPERTLSRVAVEDDKGDVLLVEKFAPEKCESRQRIARALLRFKDEGLTQALGGIPAHNDLVLNLYNGCGIQVSPFIHSTGLARPQWLDQPKVGRALAGFLIRMKSIPDSRVADLSFPVFDLEGYVRNLFKAMEENHPHRAEQYRPFLNFLEEGLWSGGHRFPMTFCHGDYHPMNVIWDDEQVKAVIDWEFAGFKPDIYDAANLVGCAGMEHPEGLVGPMVVTFLHDLGQARIVHGDSWRWFPDYVLALRFAWLSEWLRKNDTEMLETEAVYMKILIAHKNALREAWEI